MKVELGEMVDVPPGECPACGYSIDAATCIGQDAIPSPGDVTICARCCAWLSFDSEMHLQHVSPEMLAEIHADSRCRLTERACFQMKVQRN
jgi:hypothetical protein